METHVIQTIVEIFTACLIWIFSVLGNVLVCLVVYRSRRVQSTTNYFVVSMACADLVFSLVCMPAIVSRILSDSWPLGDVMCRVIRYAQYVIPGVSLYILGAICIDRFYTIIYPLSFKVTRETAKRMILISWLVSSVLSIFCFYFFEIAKGVDGRDQCLLYIPRTSWSGVTYAVCLVFLQFLVPVIMMCFGYTRVFRYIWRGGTEGRGFRFQRTMNPVPRTKVKIVKMLMLVTVTCLLLICPFYAVQFLYSVSTMGPINRTIFAVTTWLLFITSASKPLIYLWCNANFRRGCREVFCMSTMKCYRGNTYAITTASSIGKTNHIGIMCQDSNSKSMDSPSKTFNRAQVVAKSAWPLANAMPSTYI